MPYPPAALLSKGKSRLCPFTVANNSTKMQYFSTKYVGGRDLTCRRISRPHT